MAATAELSGDFADVHVGTFAAEADSGEFGFDLLKDTGDDDGFDGADVVNETLGIVALGTGAMEIGFLEPKPGDLVIGGEAEFAINVPEQFDARERVGLVNFVADAGEAGAA